MGRGQGRLCPRYWTDPSFLPLSPIPWKRAPNPWKCSHSRQTMEASAPGKGPRAAWAATLSPPISMEVLLWHTRTHDHHQGVTLCKLVVFDLHFLSFANPTVLMKRTCPSRSWDA